MASSEYLRGLQQGDGEPYSITDYARRFGPKSPQNANLKSWLTPLDPFFPLNWEHERLDDSYKVVGGYQRNELFLFTTRELKDLDAVCDRPLKKSTLTPGIIPLLRRDRWEDRPSTAWLRTDSIPIRGDPLGGKWQSSNDRVWNVLKPIVTLASRFIMSSKNLPWFDALLLGPRHPVIQDRYPPGAKIQKEFHTFHPREGPWTAEREREVEAERDRVFLGLMNEMDFMFSYFYSHQNARDNDPPNHDPNYPVKKWGDPLGVTTVNAWEMVVKKVPGAKWRVQTFINVEALEALFFDYDDLSGSEAAALRFRCATTIAHEVMHAIGYYQSLHRLGVRLFTNNREGYYADEQMAELGWSWQWAMHGGIDSKRPSNHRSRRILTQFAELQFPSFTSKSHAASGQAVLIDPPIHNWSDFHPIGVQFLEDVHNQDFWDLMVRSFGGRILQYHTIKEGTRIFYQPGSYKPFTIIKRDRLDPVSHDPYENDEALMMRTMQDVKTRMTHTPAEKKLMAFVTEIAESAKTGKAFWERMEAQVRTVRDIIQVLVQSKMNSSSGVHRDWGFMTTAVREVVELLVVAATNHERMVAFALERQQKHHGVDDIAAKGALLAWNRGTRGFNRDVLEKFGKKFKEGELGRKLNVSYNILEKCQALLFAPSQKGVKSNYPKEQKEFDTLMKTAEAIHFNQDFEGGRQMCLKLLSDRYIGSFVKSAAKLLMANCEAGNAGGVENLTLPLRHKCWKAAEQGLKRIVWLHEEISRISDAWQQLFEEYIRWGKSLVAKFTIVAAAVLPQGVEHMEDVQLTNSDARRIGKVESRKRTRREIEDLVDDAMEDVVYTDLEEWQWAASRRQYKKMKLVSENPGNVPHE
ncbi:32e08ef6-91e6-4d55-b3cf-1f6e4e45f465 [Sclerotinia trifoliorum]|uniref:32e08ef6-91e6-4d55-b3cf-1f6e4e45f465 n=1 Tax=Sclerotinia trifoliorum TaxID=28548 RepID=A0A8H2ZTX4_9HELO|nr:32e08ef6-91e6-4d55-b3cf-1f6e4e45f465 [Sclerotinia trifoliorum]